MIPSLLALALLHASPVDSPGHLTSHLRSQIASRIRTTAIVPFETDDPTVLEFARRAVGAEKNKQAQVDAIYSAIGELIAQGRIIRDRDNRPKRRRPKTGVEVLQNALRPDAEPLPAGCYELSSALIAATHAIGIETFALDGEALDEQIGHIVVGLRNDTGRPNVFDLQNNVRKRSARYRRLTPLEFAAHHYNHLAVSHHLHGEFDDARRSIDDAIALGGATPAFLNNRAAALAALGEL
ncbi:MAG: hypothetical protein AAFQ82_21245, partial [Myxococcota bacterium]